MPYTIHILLYHTQYHRSTYLHTYHVGIKCISILIILEVRSIINCYIPTVAKTIDYRIKQFLLNDIASN